MTATASPVAAHLRIEAVVKRFASGAAAAVDGVSLDIAPGEFFALLGPSGCGKTTLLRLLAGFETPDEGRILIAGADMAGVPPYRRPVNMMFQSYALFPHLTVAQNVGFGLKQDRLPRREREARVAAMLDLVKLARLAQRKPHQLSGGERQRVALARALAQEPKLVLLDEPLAALDRKLREETRFELVRIQQRVGITFLMVTHDQEEAMSMASRIAVMSQGRIVQLGTPREIYETPASRFVADFIGGVNLLEGRVLSAHDGLIEIKSAEAGGTLVVEHPALATGSAVAIAIRPEKIAFAPPAATANRLDGRVLGVAYRGEASTYEVELASGRVLRVTQVNTAPRAQPYAAGDGVLLGFAPAAAVVLPP
ncbi:MAG TPA: ABC transporter ATP-binding protein [Stellaceae bacterium]|nr:ABC transporter ATP-binding protein [Stellaceae bacterium]